MTRIQHCRAAGTPPSQATQQARIWVGDAECIAAADSSYDAVCDFGIIHHAPNWRRVLAEVKRVLKPRGVFYGEEVYAAFINHPVTRFFLEHPRDDRFDHHTFLAGLSAVGLWADAYEELLSSFGWFVARPGDVT